MSCDISYPPHAVVDVGFELAEYSVVEGDGNITLCATMTGDLDIPVSVTFSVVDPPGRDQSKESLLSPLTQT